eukprot:TRINITY_DN454_c0_g1_i1.p1 TRINITY_DN454_c0_g1~~TRINITY_DN454_c0_g1_i1.p1  ORF type:complete len:413 (-),score=119.95 TRINITY_DN454_c0_g1_i1:241-1479(-)
MFHQQQQQPHDNSASRDFVRSNSPYEGSVCLNIAGRTAPQEPATIEVDLQHKWRGSRGQFFSVHPHEGIRVDKSKGKNFKAIVPLFSPPELYKYQVVLAEKKTGNLFEGGVVIERVAPSPDNCNLAILDLKVNKNSSSLQLKVNVLTRDDECVASGFSQDFVAHDNGKAPPGAVLRNPIVVDAAPAPRRKPVAKKSRKRSTTETPTSVVNSPGPSPSSSVDRLELSSSMASAIQSQQVPLFRRATVSTMHGGEHSFSPFAMTAAVEESAKRQRTQSTPDMYQVPAGQMFDAQLAPLPNFAQSVSVEDIIHQTPYPEDSDCSSPIVGSPSYGGQDFVPFTGYAQFDAYMPSTSQQQQLPLVMPSFPLMDGGSFPLEASLQSLESSIPMSVETIDMLLAMIPTEEQMNAQQLAY